METFLQMKNTRIYIAAGNHEDTLNLLLLADSDKAIGVYGTNRKGVALPFFAKHELTNKGGQAIYNLYERPDGSRYFKVNNNKVDVFKGFGSEQEQSDFLMSRLHYVLGDDLKGKPFAEVNDHLMKVDDLIDKAGSEIQDLTEIERSYLESKSEYYIPVGWGIDSLKGFHVRDNGLFIGVNEKGQTYWSPDGSPEEQGAKCVGFIKGTSFAAPNAMMNDLLELSSHPASLAFTGKIKLQHNTFSMQSLIYSKVANL
jgi:hypothetical protein